MTERSYLARLDDILASIDFIRGSTARMTVDTFRDDMTKRLAVERCLESFQRHPVMFLRAPVIDIPIFRGIR